MAGSKSARWARETADGNGRKRPPRSVRRDRWCGSCSPSLAGGPCDRRCARWVTDSLLCFPAIAGAHSGRHDLLPEHRDGRVATTRKPTCWSSSIRSSTAHVHTTPTRSPGPGHVTVRICRCPGHSHADERTTARLAEAGRAAGRCGGSDDRSDRGVRQGDAIDLEAAGHRHGVRLGGHTLVHEEDGVRSAGDVAGHAVAHVVKSVPAPVRSKPVICLLFPAL